MSTPSKLPWYQFSLRSVLLLTLVVAVLCSIGACTHWLVSVMLDSVVLIGGVTGRIVGGTGLGLVEGPIRNSVLLYRLPRSGDPGGSLWLSVGLV